MPSAETRAQKAANGRERARTFTINGRAWTAAEDDLVRTRPAPEGPARTGRPLGRVYSRRGRPRGPDGRGRSRPETREGRRAAALE